MSQEPGTVADKGLARGAVGMFGSIAVGVASTAPAYSLAATLGFVVAVIGLQTPLLDPGESDVSLHILGWHVGGTLFVVIVTAVVGLLWMLWCERTHRAFFSGESMREGLSLTDDDVVVRAESATSPQDAGAP